MGRGDIKICVWVLLKLKEVITVCSIMGDILKQNLETTLDSSWNACASL